MVDAAEDGNAVGAWVRPKSKCAGVRNIIYGR